MVTPARPIVVVSRCLGFDACRYDGTMIPAPFLAEILSRAKVIKVCPEVAIGLGIPRDTIRIEETGGERRLIQPATGLDLTGRMRAFRDSFLDGLPAIDGFILKSRSPSCALLDANVPGPGLFAAGVLARFPEAAIEDEARLADPDIRSRFLALILSSAALR
jgi:uncharacterized protein YbbK (DUF523 family)